MPLVASVFLRWILAALAVAPSVAHAFVFAVNEGCVQGVTDAEIQYRYKPIADDLAGLVGERVDVAAVCDQQELARGLAASRYDLVYVHPVNVALKSMSIDGYRLAVLTRGFTEYRAHLLVRADSPTRVAADLQGKRIGVAATDNVTTVLMRASLRNALPNVDEGVRYVTTHYADAIPFMVQNGLVDAGVTGSERVAQAWVASGGRVAFSSKPVPIKLMLAARQVRPEMLAALQQYFTTLEQTDRGRRILEGIHKKGFVIDQGQTISLTNNWLLSALQ